MVFLKIPMTEVPPQRFPPDRASTCPIRLRSQFTGVLCRRRSVEPVAGLKNLRAIATIGIM